MRLVKNFEDTPSNSVENMVDVIEAVFSVEQMPSLLNPLIKMMGKELDIRGGVAAMQFCVDEYIAKRKETFPELKNETPNVEDFENFLFSPNRNGHITQDAMFTADFPVQVSANLTTLKVKIYMGHGWEHRHPPDLFVNLKIHGLSTGIGMSNVKNTKVQKKNRTPCWAEEFEFPLCIPPQDASLLVEVYDHNIFRPHDFAGMNTLLVFQLRPGIRAVPLFDKRGNQCAMLLISFMFV